MLRWSALVYLLTICAADPARGDESDSSAGLLASRNLVHFEIVMGRVKIARSRCGHCCNRRPDDPGRAPGETLSVNARGASTSLRYEALDETRRFTVEFASDQELQIVAACADDAGASTVRFSQPERGPLRLRIEQAGRVEEYTAACLWRLMLSHRDVCTRHLTPLLQRLRPDWRLETLADRLEAELLGALRGPAPAARAGIAELISQLGADDFAARQRAFRELRGLGQPALAHLTNVAPQSLSAEQRLRIRQLVDELTTHRGDTPQRASLWLGELPEVWIALMSHSDQQVRIRAAENLSHISGGQILFDPAASPQLRQSQLADVRQRLGTE